MMDDGEAPADARGGPHTLHPHLPRYGGKAMLTARTRTAKAQTVPPARRLRPKVAGQAIPDPTWSQLARGVQAKLKVGAKGDPLEQEADAVAERVVAGPPGGGATFSATARDRVLAPAAAHETSDSPGQPLDLVSQAFFEPRFGQNFDGVRVHEGEAAAESARTLRARAFTRGKDIFFAPGEYSPD